MDNPEIKTAGNELQQELLSIALLAFAADPFIRWMLPSASGFVDNYAKLAFAMGGKAFEKKTAYYADDFSAVALWLPPGVAADENLLTSTIVSVVPENIIENIIRLGEEIESYHPENCWYLPLLAVDPKMQGKGRGAVILKHVLQLCDNDHLPAYLESSNPTNISLYQRHGFEVMGEINVGNPQPLTPMIRQPR
ncbi:MAG: GNAT superfamily N-acetyltransferase [Oceanicoccus sp.]|jgi:GNAT superfamily N-acetyltransferase